MAGNLTNDQRKWVIEQYWKTENSEKVRQKWAEEFDTPPPTGLTVYSEQLNQPRVTVWAGLTCKGVIGPTFSTRAVTHRLYLNLPRNTTSNMGLPSTVLLFHSYGCNMVMKTSVSSNMGLLSTVL
jgi:hypothetical protein